MFVSEFVQYKSRGGKKVIKDLWHNSHFSVLCTLKSVKKSVLKAKIFAPKTL